MAPRSPKLLGLVREPMRRKHYALWTEQSYTVGPISH
jgi:hypothetical protein